MGQGHEMINVGGQVVEGQGHTRLKVDLGAWRMHYSQAPWAEELFEFCIVHLIDTHSSKDSIMAL